MEDTSPLKIGDLCILLSNDSKDRFMQEEFKPGSSVLIIEIIFADLNKRPYHIKNARGTWAKTIRKNLLKISPPKDFKDDVETTNKPFEASESP